MKNGRARDDSGCAHIILTMYNNNILEIGPDKGAMMCFIRVCVCVCVRYIGTYMEKRTMPHRRAYIV